MITIFDFHGFKIGGNRSARKDHPLSDKIKTNQTKFDGPSSKMPSIQGSLKYQDSTT